jgi:hypothetical protein
VYDVEAVFERLQYEEESLRFVDEIGDLVGYDARVSYVLVEEKGGGEWDWLKGKEEVGDEAWEETFAAGLMRKVVENALCPAGCGKYNVDGSANVRVEFLKVVGS